MSTAPKYFVFVLMPFDEDFDDVYKVGIKPACRDAGAYCERVDEQIFHRSVLQQIYNQISKADLVVADMSDRNANVFYEAGYAHALDKKMGDISLKTGGRWEGIAKRYSKAHDLDLDADVRQYEGNESVISQYSLGVGHSKYVESFAEAFSAYVHRPSWLQGTNPDMFSYMTDLEASVNKSTIVAKAVYLGDAEVFDGEELKWIVVGEVEKGGKGSGHHGHGGRPGSRGGSAARVGSVRVNRRGQRTVVLPGGFKYRLARGEKLIEVSPGVRLPEKMIAERGGEFGWTFSGRPADKPSASGPSAQQKWPVEWTTEQRLQAGVDALLSMDTTRMTPNQRRTLAGLKTTMAALRKDLKDKE